MTHEVRTVTTPPPPSLSGVRDGDTPGGVGSSPIGISGDRAMKQSAHEVTGVTVHVIPERYAGEEALKSLMRRRPPGMRFVFDVPLDREVSDG